MLLLATAAALALAELHEDDSDNVGLVLAGVLAVLGGGVVTSSVFGLVDGMSAEHDDSVRKAGEVLRGGAWIGALERLAVFVTVLAGWPEGLAVTLALKGLGRYPELRTETPGSRRAVHHRHLHQRAVGGRLRRRRDHHDLRPPRQHRT